ncbi:hypothetical protein KNT64_gp219 [Pseudomonas phage PspYZU05]|uniref:Uncharacterized protein n=1 Tax=Pseudomonas phage PspYZU05 TaxID=1983556 RepID=A0A2U7NF87_9CAUD|nr:hypothetical protein KNT64_gp219 [Pseudomonas phage PspYZU05]ASD52171.1 hypothetical protein PspYZU05_219 [Pseudomonas phage PspYZU05]
MMQYDCLFGVKMIKHFINLLSASAQAYQTYGKHPKSSSRTMLFYHMSVVDAYHIFTVEHPEYFEPVLLSLPKVQTHYKYTLDLSAAEKLEFFENYFDSEAPGSLDKLCEIVKESMEVLSKQYDHTTEALNVIELIDNNYKFDFNELINGIISGKFYYDTSGICYLIDMLCVTEHIKQFNPQDHFHLWPKFSGDKNYPIEVAGTSPATAYSNSISTGVWFGAVGRDRIELLKFLLPYMREI